MNGTGGMCLFTDYYVRSAGLGQCCNRASSKRASAVTGALRGSNQAPLALRSVDEASFLWRVSHAACTKLPLGRVARPDPLMGF